jgi:hypothetical protein
MSKYAEELQEGHTNYYEQPFISSLPHRTQTQNVQQELQVGNPVEGRVGEGSWRGMAKTATLLYISGVVVIST